MATQALTQPQVELPGASIGISTRSRRPFAAYPVSESSASSESNWLGVSRASALGGARGAMVALGMEAAAVVVAICVYGMLRL